MKRNFISILILALAISFAGCNDNGKSVVNVPENLPALGEIGIEVFAKSRPTVADAFDQFEDYLIRDWGNNIGVVTHQMYSNLIHKLNAAGVEGHAPFSSEVFEYLNENDGTELGISFLPVYARLVYGVASLE